MSTLIMIASIPPFGFVGVQRSVLFFVIIYILNNNCEIVWHFQKGGLVP